MNSHAQKEIYLLKKLNLLGTVVHACGPNYSGGSDQLRPVKYWGMAKW
jgi:hypothetical protein